MIGSAILCAAWAIAAEPVSISFAGATDDVVLTVMASQDENGSTVTAKLTREGTLQRQVVLKGPASVSQDPLEFVSGPARGGRLLTLQGLGPVMLGPSPRRDRPAVLSDDIVRVFVSDAVFERGRGLAQVFDQQGHVDGFAVTELARARLRPAFGPDLAMPDGRWLAQGAGCAGRIPRAGVAADRSRIVLSAPVCFADFAVARATFARPGRKPQVGLVQLALPPLQN